MHTETKTTQTITNIVQHIYKAYTTNKQKVYNIYTNIYKNIYTSMQTYTKYTQQIHTTNIQHIYRNT